MTPVAIVFNLGLDFEAECGIDLSFIFPRAAFCILNLAMKGFILADTSEIFRQWKHSVYPKFRVSCNYVSKDSCKI